MAIEREALAGLRILIVEDELLVAMLEEEMLQDLGCVIVGPASTLEDAIAILRSNHVDGVLLDCNRNGKSSSPVADDLLGLGVPFLLVTGYGGSDADPPALRTASRLKKPFDFNQLANRMTEVFC